MDEEWVMSIVICATLLIVLVIFIADKIASQRYYSKIVNSIFDGTYALKEAKYSSTNKVILFARQMLIWGVLWVVLGVVLLLWGPKASGYTYLVCVVVGIAIVLAVLLARGKREITLSDEGVTLKRCATINGADQEELHLAWDEIESVMSIAEIQKAVITLTNGSKVEVKLNSIAPEQRVPDCWNSQEIVWQIEQRLRQRKA